MTLNLRMGLASDVDTCVRILTAWVDETPWAFESDTHQQLVALWSDYFQTFSVWVAEVDGAIVGFCTRNDDNISALYVRADWRNKGIGKRLLDRAKANRDGITVWAYGLNEKALKFYTREGLVEVSREIEDGTDLVNIEHRWTRQV